MNWNKSIIYATAVAIVISFVLLSCKQQSSGAVSDQKMIEFVGLDTIETDNRVSLISDFELRKKDLSMIHTFSKNSLFDKRNLFDKDSHISFCISYNDSLYKDIIGLDCNNREPFLGVYKGDSIDNIEGFNPLFIENDVSSFLIMEGYYWGCNGSFCNFGSILVLQFKETELQKIYLFGIDKTIYSLHNIELQITEIGELKLQIHSNTNESSLNLIFNDRISLEDKALNICDTTGLICIK